MFALLLGAGAVYLLLGDLKGAPEAVAELCRVAAEDPSAEEDAGGPDRSVSILTPARPAGASVGFCGPN